MTAITEFRHTFGLKQVAHLLDRNRPPIRPHYPPGELVSIEYRLEVPLHGRWVRVPPETVALIALAHLRRFDSIPFGDHYLDLPVDHYPVVFVDLSRQDLKVEPVTASAKDLLEVTLKVSVSYRVTNFVKVASIKHFPARLADELRAAVGDFIRLNPHDRLAPGLEKSSAPAWALEAELKAAIKQRPGFHAVEILDVLLEQRRGDPQRIEPVRQAVRTRTEVAQRLQIEEDRSHLRLRELELEKQRQAIEEEVRLGKAHTDNAVDVTRLEPEFARVNLIHQQESQRLAHERQIASLQAQTQVLQSLLTSLTQLQTNSGLQPLNSAEDRLAVLQAAERLLDKMNGQAAPVLPKGDHQPLNSQPLKVQVAEELSEVLAAGVQLKMEPEADGLLKVKAALEQISILLELDGDYRQRGPRRVQYRLDGQAHYHLVKAPWMPGTRLLTVFQKALEQALAIAQTANRRTAGDGPSQPVAG